jgi:PAS domain S-box-containing protein
MSTRERTILRSKAGRPTKKKADMGHVPRSNHNAAWSYPLLKNSPTKASLPHSANVLPEYTSTVDRNRRYVQVSDSFCKLLGYQRDELIGRKYDELTAPRTNDIPTIFELFVKSGYMHGIWILVHRRGTRILVRYEAWLRPDGFTESQMELLGAGA